MYSLGGVQCEIISSPGVVITMSGCGSHLGVVYQETEGKILCIGNTISAQYSIIKLMY